MVLAVAFLLLAGTTLSPGSAQLGVGEASASECVWKRHSKRVVKRVRRHGRVRKVVRRKVWWTCVPQTAAPIASAPTPVPPNPPPYDSEPELEANRLAVKSVEYYYVLSRPTVKAGEVTIELNNQGEDPHNLNLRLEGDEGPPLEIPETQSLQRTVADFELAAGKYRLWCSLPEHDEKGMNATLLVE